MRTLLSILIISIFVTSTAFALVAGPSKLVGKVKSFGPNVVTIDNEKATYKVPRQFITEKNLKVGSKIEVLLNNEQLGKIKVTKKKQTKK